MGGRETLHRRQRPRALVHDRLPSRTARGRLARDARPVARLPPAAVQFLRSQSRARCTACAGSGEMKAILVIPVIAALVMALCTPALAERSAPAATLMYLDQQGWQQASGQAKTALAADFM